MTGAQILSKIYLRKKTNVTLKTRITKADTLPFEVRSSVATFGSRIRMARLRRKMEQEELARACGVTRRTIWRIETGEPGVAFGTILTVLWKLGLLDSAAGIADPDQDEHGKILEAARMPQRARQRSTGSLDNNF